MKYLLMTAALLAVATIDPARAQQCMPCMTKCSICFNAGKSTFPSVEACGRIARREATARCWQGAAFARRARQIRVCTRKRSCDVRFRNSGKHLLALSFSGFDLTQMRWMAPAHGIWVPKCEGHQAFTSKMGAIRHADYHDRPRLGQERFSGPRR